ncbi:IPP transferase-domain-containing protein [Lasiosphaeria miniovina]|uniref:tRNA dimethylallyltransferase n=1 Tax=Lasiosphaeria miniovina TaxID=1954250 RepID=A0AA40B598_9PEZI|nr:IPP transferase-domain-containing protein [Lasiosphaeria miniovina]KAK0727858.1 IPP transferase-domain-containing protein [Lasiosphaeria miniovina]
MPMRHFFASIRRFSLSARHSRRLVMDPLVVIYGCTGTGKSDLAVELAVRFNGEVINADAMQMYQGLPIITNKITAKEQRDVRHYLLGNIPLEEEPWTVIEYKREATRIISEIRSRGKLPILVGGSSYYLDGLLFENQVVERQPDTDGDVLTQTEIAAKFPILSDSADAMLKKLREVDPAMADKWHPNDVRKIRNSLQIFLTTGRRASEIYAENQSLKVSKWAHSDPAAPTPSPWNALLLWLYANPESLNPRLDSRVDRMVENGLIAETAEVYDYLEARLTSGETIDRTKGIWQSIGFRQFEPYLCALKAGETAAADLSILMEAGIVDTKTATRRYAKYQVRWVTMKTLTSLQEEKALDRFYLLDSSDIKSWGEEVLAKSVELTGQLLAGEPMPLPTTLSETARAVLTSKVERSNHQVTPCRRVCDLCNKVVLTEELWQTHMQSNRHRAAVRYAKRTALVGVDQPRPDVMAGKQALEADSQALEADFQVLEESHNHIQKQDSTL